MTEIKSAVDHICSFFRAPLEAKGADLSSISDEVDEAVDYARKYLSIARNSYPRVWYRLHTCPDATSWPNLLLICELLFSLPFSTGKVERLFSSLKTIKTEKRTSLHVSTVHGLMEIKAEGPSLCNFSPDAAVDLWWSDSTGRRVNQKPRKEYRKRTQNTAEEEDEDEQESALTLHKWDEW